MNKSKIHIVDLYRNVTVYMGNNKIEALNAFIQYNKDQNWNWICEVRGCM